MRRDESCEHSAPGEQRVHGVELSAELAGRTGDVAVAELPAIPMRSETYDGVYSALTLDHFADHLGAARVTKPGAVLALVMNYPVWRHRNRLLNDSDGEVLWRPGDYFSTTASEIPAGGGTVIFHHHSKSDLLNAAADAGWGLERMVGAASSRVRGSSRNPTVVGLPMETMGI